MKKSKKDKKQREKLPLDYMPNVSNVVSANECTGLVPGQSLEEAELASELGLFSTSLPPVWPEDEPEGQD